LQCNAQGLPALFDAASDPENLMPGSYIFIKPLIFIPASPEIRPPSRPQACRLPEWSGGPAAGNQQKKFSPGSSWASNFSAQRISVEDNT
jgi:hypothetical protein